MGTSTPTFTLDEMIACVKRELQLRKSVYAKRVTKGMMDPIKARREYDCMCAVLENLIAQQPSLFTQGELSHDH